MCIDNQGTLWEVILKKESQKHTFDSLSVDTDWSREPVLKLNDAFYSSWSSRYQQFCDSFLSVLQRLSTTTKKEFYNERFSTQKFLQGLEVYGSRTFECANQVKRDHFSQFSTREWKQYIEKYIIIWSRKKTEDLLCIGNNISQGAWREWATCQHWKQNGNTGDNTSGLQ